MSTTVTVVPDYTNKALADPNVATSIADQLLDVLPTTLATLGTAAELAKVPKSDGSVVWNATALAAISSAAGLTAKQKSILGIQGQKGFIDYFNQVADGAAPSTTFWTVTSSTGTTVVDTSDAVGVLKQSVASAANDFTIASTLSKWIYSIKGDVSTIHFKTLFTIDDFSITGGFGFVASDATLDIALWRHSNGDNRYNAGLLIFNDTVNFFTNDGANDELTDVSAFVSTQGTFYTIEVVVSATDVKLYVNGTLRATHATYIPARTLQVCTMARSKSGAAGVVSVKYIEVWTE